MSAHPQEALDTSKAALFNAVRERDAKTVHNILSEDASNINATNGYDTPLILAVFNDDLETVKVLLEYKANIEARNDRGETALLPAVRLNRLDIINILVERNANIEARDTFGFTPLLRAVGLIDVMEILLAKGANVNAQTNHGDTALHASVRIPSLSPIGNVTALLRHKPNLEAKNADGYTPLLCAAELGHADVVGELIRHGADIHATNKNGEGLAKIATEEAAKLCQNPTKLSLHLADGFLETDSTLKQLPESKNGQEAISQVLKNLKSESKKNEVLTELCNSLEAKRPESFKETLARLKGFYTAFDKTNYSTATIVRTEFNRALFNYSFQAISLQIGSANNIVATPKTPEAKKLKEYLAQLKEMVPTTTPVRILFFDTIADKEIAHHPAKIYCAIKALQLCLNCSPSAKKTKLDILSESFLNLATIKTESQIPKPTEESKSTTTQEQKSTKTKRLDFLFHDGLTNENLKKRKEFHGPERLKKLREAQRIIRDGSLPSDSHTTNGFSTLIYLILHGFSFLARNFLSLNDPDLGHKDAGGLTALHWAAYKGNSVVVRALIASMASKKRLDLLDVQEPGGHTPLMMAIYWGYLDIVKLLLAAGANLHNLNEYGETALEFALRHKRQNIVDFLEQYQTLLPTENSSDSTPESKEAPKIKLLTPQQAFLKFGAVNPKSTLEEQQQWQKEQEALCNQKITAQELIAAIKDGNHGTLKEIFDTAKKAKDIIDNKDAILLDAKKDGKAILAAATKTLKDIENIVNYVDSDDKTPWFYAVQEDNAEAMVLLIQYGADVNRLNELGQSTLHIAAFDGNVDAIETLFSPIIQTPLKAKGVRLDIESRTPLGNTALSAAVINEQLNTTTALLAAGANYQTRNKNGETPLGITQRPVDDKLADAKELRTKRAEIAKCLTQFQEEQAKELQPRLGLEVTQPLLTRSLELGLVNAARPANLILEYFDNQVSDYSGSEFVPVSFTNRVNAERLEKLLAPIRPTDMGKHIESIYGDERWEIIRETQKRIARGINVNFTDEHEHGGNVLIYLIMNGYASLTREVLRTSPNLISFRDTQYKANALHWAACKASPSIMRALLEKLQETNQLALIDAQNIGGYTPLMQAILAGHIEVAKLLIAAGADFKKLRSNNENSAYNIAQNYGYQEELITFMDEFGEPPRDEKGIIHLTDKQRALTVGMFTDTVDGRLFENAEQRALFEQQCRERKSQELVDALKDGETEKVARLTANLKSTIAVKDKEAKEVKHSTPSLDFDPNYKDNHDLGLLHHAAIAGNDRLVSRLLEHKANINALSKNGNTALHLAALHDRPTAIEILLKAGADATIKNKKGQKPLELAKAAKQSRAAHIIKETQKPEPSFFSSVMQFFASEKPESKEAAKEPEKVKEEEDDEELFTSVSSTPVGMGMSLNGDDGRKV